MLKLPRRRLELACYSEAVRQKKGYSKEVKRERTPKARAEFIGDQDEIELELAKGRHMLRPAWDEWVIPQTIPRTKSQRE